MSCPRVQFVRCAERGTTSWLPSDTFSIVRSGRTAAAAKEDEGRGDLDGVASNTPSAMDGYVGWPGAVPTGSGAAT